MIKRFQWLRASVLGAGLAAISATCAAAPTSAQFDLIQQEQAEGANITVTAKVWIKGNKVRMETKNPMTGEMLMISDGTNFYMLSPVQKAGNKNPVPSTNGKKKTPWEILTPEVNSLRSRGKKVGRETIEGVACDVYAGSEGDKKKGATGTFKAWIGTVANTPLPMRLEMKYSMSRPGASVSRSRSMAIKNLKVNSPIDDARFSVPKGYTITSGSGAPAMPGMPQR